MRGDNIRRNEACRGSDASRDTPSACHARSRLASLPQETAFDVADRLVCAFTHMNRRRPSSCRSDASRDRPSAHHTRSRLASLPQETAFDVADRLVCAFTHMNRRRPSSCRSDMSRDPTHAQHCAAMTSSETKRVVGATQVATGPAHHALSRLASLPQESAFEIADRLLCVFARTNRRRPGSRRSDVSRDPIPARGRDSRRSYEKTT